MELLGTFTELLEKSAQKRHVFWVLFLGKKGQKSGTIYCFQVIIIITQ